MKCFVLTTLLYLIWASLAITRMAGQSVAPLFLLDANKRAVQDTTVARLRANIAITYLSLQMAELQTLYRTAPQQTSIVLPCGDATLVADLVRVNPLVSYFSILAEAQQKTDTLSYRSAVFYRGRLRDKAHSLVAISVFENKVMGVLSDERGNFVLAKTQDNSAQTSATKSINATDYVLYEDKMILQQMASTHDFCSTNEDAPDTQIAQSPLNTERRSLPDTVKVYFECSYLTYLNNNSSLTETTDYVTAMFNVVAALYANDGIQLEMTPLRVWTVADPYDSWWLPHRIEQFRHFRTVFDGEQAQFLNLTPYTSGGIAAGFNTFCTPYSYSLADLTFSYAQLPVYSWNIAVIAHELGHVMGSRHTHWCGWVGGAIDACAGGVEPDKHGNSCSQPDAPIAGGTVMSYCHLQRVGTNFANGFGQQPAQRIRDCISGRPCKNPNPTGLGGISIAFDTTMSHFYMFGRWQVNGGDSLTYLETKMGLQPGWYSLHFTDADDYAAPDTLVQVFANNVTIVKGNFRPLYIKYCLNIAGANGQGKWTMDYGTTWHSSGDTIAVARRYPASLALKDIVGWRVVSYADIFNPYYNNQVNIGYAVYRPNPISKFTVHLEGDDGLGQWGLYNDNYNTPAWHNSDDTILMNNGIPYLIAFKQINGYDSPDWAYVLDTLATPVVSRTYRYKKHLQNARLAVHLVGDNGLGRWSAASDTAPIAYRSGDTIRISSDTTYISGTYVEGTYCAAKVTKLYADSVVTDTLFYIPYKYTDYHVHIKGGGSNARWRMSSRDKWRRSDEPARDVIVPSYSLIEFQDTMYYWKAPPQKGIYFRSDTIRYDTFEYVPRRKLPIVILLHGDNGFGRWTVDSINWLQSGDTAWVRQTYWTNGSKFIYFSHVPDLTTPYRIDFYPTADTGYVFNAYYLRPFEYHDYQVHLKGGNGKGIWYFPSAQNTPQISDAILHDIAMPGQYYITFADTMRFWKAPPTQMVWLDGTTIVRDTFEYTPRPTTPLTVSFTGGNGKGRWSLDSLQWYNSGDTLFIPQRTTHNFVYFKYTNAWLTPEPIFFLPNKDSLFSLQTAYIKAINQYGIRIKTPNITQTSFTFDNGNN